ncbi:MAG: ArnT family glycosyltransferase [Candidatus Krumholzibacteriia bacterium]
MTRRTPDSGSSVHKAARSPLLAVLLLAFGLRLAAVLWLSDTVPFSDYLYYHMAGEKISEDWSFFFDSSQVEYYGKFGWWPPVYPFAVGTLYTLFGVNHRPVVFLQVAVGTFLCWCVYRIGRQAGGERVGLVAALLAAVNPTWIFMTNLLASENLFSVWLALGLLLAIRTWRHTRGLAVAGAVFGLGALTRAIGLLVPVVVALWLRGRAPGRRARLRSAAWMLGACALVIVPWTLRNALVVGSPAIVCFGGGINFYFGHNEVGVGYRDLAQTPMAHLADQASIDRMGYRLGLRYIADDPLGFMTRGARKIVDLFGIPVYAPHGNSAILLPDGWRSDPVLNRIAQELRARQRAKNRYLDGIFTQLAAVHSYLILVGALAAALILWGRLPAELRLMVYLSLYWLGSHALFWGQPRFRYPMELFLTLLAAFAIAQWIRRQPRTAPEVAQPRVRPGRKRWGNARARSRSR